MVLNQDFKEFIQSLNENEAKLGYPPNRIDILMTPKGIDFATCYEQRVLVDIDGTTCSFIDLENLLKNKRATGRHQDLADVENLELE